MQQRCISKCTSKFRLQDYLIADRKKTDACLKLYFYKISQLLSHVQLFATPWTVAHQASPPMGFSRQEFWRGLPLLSPGDFPDPGIEPGSPALQVDSLPSEAPGKPLYFMGKVGLIAAPLSQQWL